MAQKSIPRWSGSIEEYPVSQDKTLLTTRQTRGRSQRQATTIVAVAQVGTQLTPSQPLQAFQAPPIPQTGLQPTPVTFVWTGFLLKNPSQLLPHSSSLRRKRIIMFLVQRRRQSQDQGLERTKLSQGQLLVLERISMQSAPSLRKSWRLHPVLRVSRHHNQLHPSLRMVYPKFHNRYHLYQYRVQPTAQGTKPTVPPPVALESDSSPVFIVPIVEISLRWYVEGMR